MLKELNNKMKKLLNLTLVLFLAFLYSCGGGDDTPQVIPTVSFTQDRQVIEADEVVTFTSTHTDAVSFLWNFGDNTTSTEENPVHTYTATGNYTVRLIVTSSSGDEASTTSSVVVGNRWSLGLGIETISFVNANNEPWDADGSGPELLFGFFEVGAPSFVPFVIGNDLTTADLPVGGSIDATDQVMFTDTDWTFAFIDNDEPFDDLNESEFMAFFNINPVTIESTKDYETGEGFFEFSSDGFSFVIAFQVR